MYSFVYNPTHFYVMGDFTLSCDVVFDAGDVYDKDNSNEI